MQNLPKWAKALVSPTGLFGWFFLLFLSTRHLLQLVSEVDYVATYLPSVAKLLDSGAGFAAAFIVGCAIIGFAIFRSSRVNETGSSGDGGLAARREDRLSHKQRLRELELLTEQSATRQADDDLKFGFAKATFQRSPSRENALLLLTQLRRKGVAIRNDASGIQFTGQLDGWASRVDAWRQEAIKALAAIDRADSDWFAILDIVPPARVPLHVRLTGEFDAHSLQSLYGQLDCRLDRLDRLLRKYGVGVS
ncbi:MAG: hypothetical protein AAB663_02395 [Patescibacteria group bacterium]